MVHDGTTAGGGGGTAAWAPPPDPYPQPTSLYSCMADQTIAGIPLERVLERKDRLLQQLTTVKPAGYTALIGRLQGLANRSVGNSGFHQWDVSKVCTVARLEGHDRSVTAMAVANGELVSGSEDGVIMLWDMDALAPRLRLQVWLLASVLY